MQACTLIRRLWGSTEASRRNLLRDFADAVCCGCESKEETLGRRRLVTGAVRAEKEEKIEEDQALARGNVRAE